MKNIFLLLLLSIAFSGFSQLPSGTIVEDFTVTTLDGSTFNLYDELRFGRPVLIDISATWCGPCWSYHNTHAFKDTWNTHGPDGDDKIRMLFLEGDPSTNENCLYGSSGCNGSTAGDWTAGTPYPMSNDAYVAQSILDIDYYPTIYLICPDTTIREIGKLSSSGLWNVASACVIEPTSHNARVLSLSSGLPGNEFCKSYQITPKMELVSNGTELLTSATIELKYNGSLKQTVHWTGNLSNFAFSLQKETIEFDAINLTQSGSLEVEITSINGGILDENLSDNTSGVQLIKVPDEGEQNLIVEILTDEYGAELYWEIRNFDGTVIQTGGNQAVGPNGGAQFSSPPIDPNAYGAHEQILENVSLPQAGCYYVHITDSYGDGLCCGFGDGYFKVYNESDISQSNLLINVSNFKASATKRFGTNDFSNIENLLPSESLQLFPNPTHGKTQLSFNLKQNTKVYLNLRNALGKTIKHINIGLLTTGQQNITFDTSELPNGLYTATLLTEKGAISKKFTVLK